MKISNMSNSYLSSRGFECGVKGVLYTPELIQFLTRGCIKLVSFTEIMNAGATIIDHVGDIELKDEDGVESFPVYHAKGQKMYIDFDFYINLERILFSGVKQKTA